MDKDAALKMRVHRARKHAADNLRKVGYGVIMTESGTFDLIAVRESDARYIRVITGVASLASASATCKGYALPVGSQREIWQCVGGKEFKITVV